LKQACTIQLRAAWTAPVLVSISILFLVLALAARASESAEGAGLEFFEKKIRPLLAEHCYQCHSRQSEKLKGGLFVDSREGLLQGGDTGPAIVPGAPEKSLLIKAVRYADPELQMPPKDKKLSQEQIADLETWVQMGAPDPRTGQAVVQPEAESARKHWAFQPVRKPPLPKVRHAHWGQSPIDAFILAGLEARGLQPSAPADKRTLIRRASFDLIGLPPTPEQVEEFLQDKSKDAFARVIDRLLGSPQYGERWARYWLDVARYADTKGYVFEEERRYPYAYTYRDYVIRAFNEDLPYDQFIVQQIAADQLNLGDDKRPLAALGYLTLGRRFLNNQPDIIDDRIDVVTRGFMGLTVTCARCHDHKYDPIPTEDYYSLYGVFASTREPEEKPLLGDKVRPMGYDDYLAEKKKREEELNRFKTEKEGEALKQLRERAGDYLLAAFDSQKLDKSKAEALARERKLDPGVVQRWITKLESWRKEGHPVFGPWFAFTDLSEADFSAKARELASQCAPGSGSVLAKNALVAKAFAGEPPASMKEVAERYGKLFAVVEKQWTDLTAASQKEQRSAPKALPEPAEEELRLVLYAEDAPPQLPESEVARLLDVPSIQKVRALRRKVEEVDATHPGAPPRAMVLVDRENPHDPKVFVRGNPQNHGRSVPRQFLGLLAGETRKPFQKGSGRLELAQAIASEQNPLTARVLVNRVWMYHFGTPLVRTTGDFGLRSEPPTHPELLDYLAARFMEEGWSIKKLHRLIMLSSAYQQRSEERPEAASIDNANALYWRMNRRRLDFEAFRDTLLEVSGKIDYAAGGHSVDITREPFPTRRTVYAFIERQNLPGVFRTFDFASPDTTSPQRYFTTVPQQALFMVNSPFAVQQARSLAGRTASSDALGAETRIRHLYLLAFQREPNRDEIRLGLKFLKEQAKVPPRPPELPVWKHGFGEYDEAREQVKQFSALPYFTGDAYQGGAKLPDAQLGWVMLNANGGHVGNDLQHAAIRRWIAPQDGTISITGTLGHDSDKGDGVRGFIVSSREGELGSWIVRNRKQPTKIEAATVQKGDTIDFITHLRDNLDSDTFTWVPVIKIKTSGSDGQEWNAKLDFSGPKEIPRPLDPWEKYAQVLLMSNELAFVD
jgi:mono/diheme cytochrome c family protein